MKRLVALLLLLGILGGLLVVGDRVAAQVAGRVVARGLAGELGGTPRVQVRGVPFLTQAAAGRYRDVQVGAGRVARGTVVLQSFTARLRGVRLPPGDALHGRVDAVPVDHLAVTGVLAYADLERLAGTPGLRLRPDPGGVRVSGRLRVLGLEVDASAVSTVRLDGDTLVVRATDVQVGGIRAVGAVATALAGRLDLRVPLRGLPYGVRVTAVQPGPQGVTVSGSADDVVLRR